MSLHLVIITEIISPYRIPVFNVLAEREGLDLHVIFLAETDASLRQWRIYKDEIHFSYEVLKSWRWRAGKRNFLLNRGLWPALNSSNPQVVSCGGYNYLASWAALRWTRRREARFILWSESNRQDARRGLMPIESLKRYFLRHCDAFVVPGKSAFAYLHDLGAPAENVFSAPNAVDNGYFTAAAHSARTHDAAHRERLGLPVRFILYAGRLVPEKGVFDLLEAYARLEPDLRAKVGLVFAGDGPSRRQLVSQAQQIQPGSVCFPGFVQREDLAVLYSLAETLVLPTHSDPWGLVVNEAMVCGLPIIVTNVAGCAQDLVDDGWNGRVVPPRDPERLASAIGSLLQDPEIRSRMSANSRERIQRYSPVDCAQGLAQAAMCSRAERL